MSEEQEALESLMAFAINEREKRRFREWSSLDSQLPIIMDNGFVIENPVFFCTMCEGRTVFGENLRGEFRTVAGGDIRLTGYGFCGNCFCLSTLRQHYRQQIDGTVIVDLILRDDPIPIMGAEIISNEIFQKKRRKKHGIKEEDHSPSCSKTEGSNEHEQGSVGETQKEFNHRPDGDDK